MNNLFVKQFDQNIKFNYSCFDRVILRGYIIRLFFAGGIAVLLRTLGFNSLSNSVMRILTDHLNSHIEKIAKARNIPINWWPSIDGGTDGAKQKFIQEKYAASYKGKDNHLFCILTDSEPCQTFVCRELTSYAGKKFQLLYKCENPPSTTTSISTTLCWDDLDI